jgi:hypothetical protein
MTKEKAPDLWLDMRVMGPDWNQYRWDSSDGTYDALIVLWFATLDSGEPRSASSEYDPLGWSKDLLFSFRVHDNFLRDDLGARGTHWWQFGAEVSHSRRFPASSEALARLAKNVAKVERAYEGTVKRFGPPKSFGQFVMYHADPLKVKGIVRPSPRPDVMGKWQTWTEDLAQFIDSQVYDAVRACRTKANKDGEIPAEAVNA